VPEKGAAFEVHFGGDNSKIINLNGEHEYTVSAVGIACDTLTAIKLVGMMELWLENDTLCDDDVLQHIYEDWGISVLYVEDLIEASSFSCKLL
jgi:hypothetical protein